MIFVREIRYKDCLTAAGVLPRTIRDGNRVVCDFVDPRRYSGSEQGCGLVAPSSLTGGGNSGGAQNWLQRGILFCIYVPNTLLDDATWQAFQQVWNNALRLSGDTIRGERFIMAAESVVGRAARNFQNRVRTYFRREPRTGRRDRDTLTAADCELRITNTLEDSHRPPRPDASPPVQVEEVATPAIVDEALRSLFRTTETGRFSSANPAQSTISRQDVQAAEVQGNEFVDALHAAFGRGNRRHREPIDARVDETPRMPPRVVAPVSDRQVEATVAAQTAAAGSAEVIGHLDWNNPYYWRSPNAENTEMVSTPIPGMADAHLYTTICYCVEHRTALFRNSRESLTNINVSPAMAASRWLANRPAFRSMLNEAGRRAMAFPGQVAAYIRNFVSGAASVPDDRRNSLEPWRVGAHAPENIALSQSLTALSTTPPTSPVDPEAAVPPPVGVPDIRAIVNKPYRELAL